MDFTIGRILKQRSERQALSKITIKEQEILPKDYQQVRFGFAQNKVKF